MFIHEYTHNYTESSLLIVKFFFYFLFLKVFGSALEQLHQRTWLLHWSLFPTFKSGNEDFSKFVETCFLTK